jgi:cytochrome P450
MTIDYAELPVIDLAQPDWWREPMTVTAPMLAAHAPAAFVPSFGTVFFLRYEDCLAGLNDPNLRAMGARYFEMQGWTDGPFVDWIRLNVVMMNPPGHTRLRKLVSRAFTPRAVARMREVSQRVSGELCDQVDDVGGRVEFVHDWARVLPLRVVCEMIGIPRVDVGQMAEWALGLTMASGVTTPEAREAGDRGMTGFNEYVSAMIAERRAHPTDDLLTALIDAEEDGDRLSPAELVAMVVQLIFAGHETTQNLLGNGLYRLLQNPDQLAAVRADRTLVPNAVEEMLRYDPPITFTSRIACEPTTIAGIDVAEDQLVMLNLTAANHDPERFPNPSAFDVRRPEIRHLSFGWGVHYCLGASLARLEGEVAFSTLLDRYATIAEVTESDWTSFTPLRGRQRLDLELS